ncbi:hypothetical protein EYF80_027282 [Liparis tanakae]|uniref:Uncharacterized protein n=1 Tax=Liparis tanakae TaxID=230148 RepID=A0A4Z2H9H6_9TELE|nr:hypothetical protein EYF80_027282 [Liparis tanakae]
MYCFVKVGSTGDSSSEGAKVKVYVVNSFVERQIFMRILSKPSVPGSADWLPFSQLRPMSLCEVSVFSLVLGSRINRQPRLPPPHYTHLGVPGSLPGEELKNDPGSEPPLLLPERDTSMKVSLNASGTELFRSFHSLSALSTRGKDVSRCGGERDEPLRILLPQRSPVQLPTAARLKVIGSSWAFIYGMVEQINDGIR